MSMWRRLAARLGSERGFTLIESIATLAILTTVMGAMTALMISGTQAEAELNRRFQAQTDAQIALSRLRREIHCATASTAANPGSTITLTVPAGCSSDNVTSITWCTVASGGTYELWRYRSSACSGTGRKWASWLTTQNAFVYTAPSGSTSAGTGALATIVVTLAINLTPSFPERVYTLADTIALRNTTRPA